jgi:hypothetical protein
MLGKDQFGHYLNTFPDSLQQFLDMGVPDRGPSALTMGPIPAPTPLPASNDTPLPSAWWESDLGGSGGEASLQAGWAGEEGADFLAESSDVQDESPAPSGGGGVSSTSSPGSHRVVQRRRRRKEEGGWCNLCNRWFSRRSDIRRHKNTAHAKEVHACPQCHIICSRRDALQRHMRDQH